jgi:hypothetical protein
MAPRKQRMTESVSVDDPLDDAVADTVTSAEADKQPTPEEMVEQLKAQMAEKDTEIASTRARAEAAEKERATATSKVTVAENDVIATRENAYVLALEKTQSDLDRAKQQLEDALAGGDTKAVVEAQEALSDAKYDVRRIKDEQKAFDGWKKQEEAKKAAAPKTPVISPAAKTWIDEHPQFETNKRYRAIAIAAHEEALENGVRADSKAYFDYINGALEESGLSGKSPRQAPSTSQTTAAPASHDSSTSAPRRASDVRLTADEIEAAEMCNMTPGEYAKFKYGTK